MSIEISSPWEIVGFLAAFLTMFGFLPQVIKVYRAKSAKDISLFGIVQFLGGISLWVMYGIHLKNFVIILANSITLIILLVLFVLFFRYNVTGGERP